ncbi:MAG: hypothetical protein HN403_08265 [Rhodospirillales bacterium]|jgi:hypothetical protein|nr:hypothetical protein [Rhodospirillales bacterium]
MLAEWFSYLTTRCPKHLREMGYLREIIATRSRYGRCKKAWEPHLQETRTTILAAAGVTSHKKVAVLGSGLLYDVPLAELAGIFEEVVLIDIFHMPAVRRAAAKFRNVRLIAHDLTGGDLPESDADLVVSVNLLTQLPFIPRRVAGESEDFSRAIMAHHLEQLASVRGTTCLVTEVEHLVYAGDQLIERTDPLYGISLGEPDREWFWDIAPHPELHRQYDTRYRVIAKIS